MNVDGHTALLTQCPHCATVFRLNAAILATARGFVECGECSRVFFSLERLADEPPGLAPAPLATTGITMPRVLMHPLPASEELDHIPPTPVARDNGSLDEIPVSDIPPVLREDVARRKQRKQARRRARWTQRWARFAALLLLGFALQVGWAARMLVLERYPGLAPYLAQFCAVAGCRAQLPLPPPDVALLARDVREHPVYKDALLVNATLVNQEKKATAFPSLELRLLDESGKLLGVRRFAPGEYLDASVDLKAGMLPGRAAQVVLEIGQVSRHAAGFEFSFR